jgi:DUF1680 family protein
MSKLAVSDQLSTPASGVRLTSGLFREVLENNTTYLKSLSLDSILYWFRVKAGLPAPGEPYRGHFEDNIKGQTAGLFLMGAGNTLRWQEDELLRERLEAIVDGIGRAQEPGGYFMAVPKGEFGTKEYPNYVRAWLTYGLLAAGRVGNTTALPLLRGMQDWFNRCDERVIAKDLLLGYQGMIASTSAYLSPIGKQEDLDTAVQCYQENWWLAEFVRRYPGAVYEHSDPHGYELTAIEAYLDLYRATGKPLYLNAVNAAYEMFRAHWQHVGGGIVMIEATEVYPGCNWLDPVHPYNELCCSVFWIYLNQRYHWLYPQEERYVGEIEKSLYNVLLANQKAASGIRYHANLDIQKEVNYTPVTCCAGQGTRLYASLPEFLYSLAPDGVYVDIYAASELDWQINGVPAKLTAETGMPASNEVRIRLALPAPQPFRLRLRMPAWAAAPVKVALNGAVVGEGKPGSYYELSRTWAEGDVMTFTLPMAFRVIRYQGGDTVPGHERYALEYGPVLLGLAGAFDYRGRYIRLNHNPADPSSWLDPIPGKPLHFSVRGKPRYEYLPYYEIGDQPFTCYPIMG